MLADYKIPLQPVFPAAYSEVRVLGIEIFRGLKFRLGPSGSIPVSGMSGGIIEFADLSINHNELENSMDGQNNFLQRFVHFSLTIVS